MFTRYLNINDVLGVHRAILGNSTVRDLGLLESAVHRPQSSALGQDAYPHLHEKAAALFHGLIRNHPFIDGNKRTAVVSVAVFYSLNGYELQAADTAVVALALDVAEGVLDVAGIAGHLKDMAAPLPDGTTSSEADEE